MKSAQTTGIGGDRASQSPDGRVLVNPDSLASARGYNHGVFLGISGDRGVLFVAGQVAWDREGRIVSERFADQFEQALANVLDVVAHAGGSPDCIGKMTIYVTDVAAYRAARPELHRIWHRRIGSYYPTITLVGVKSLLESLALVEIDALAVISAPPSALRGNSQSRQSDVTA